MAQPLRIIVVEEDEDRGLGIATALRADLTCDVEVTRSLPALAQKIADYHPDVVLIDIDNPTRDVLEELTLASGPMERPVAMFVSRAGTDLAREAIEAGVSAYVVDGLEHHRLKPVIDTAIARFGVQRRVQQELLETRRALEERKVIDRAKGLLMKAKGIDEEAAYGLLRRRAMDQGQKVAEIASALVTAADLLR